MSKRFPFMPACAVVLTELCLTLPVAARDKAWPVPGPLSEQSEECIGCHEEYTPGMVADWRMSRHAVITPEKALAKPKIQRRVSADAVPEQLRATAVGCFECHGLNTAAHQDTFNHFGFEINVVVSPNDCSVCHPIEAEQYGRSKKAHALDNLTQNPVYDSLVDGLAGIKTLEGAKLVHHAATAAAKGVSCYGCHGTAVTVRGLKTVHVGEDREEVEVPDLANWPNQGVGRINPDGSRGACTACHPRHGFSIEVARKPFTCAQCHLEPDVPAWDVYRESKHGNIMLSSGQEANWAEVPWHVGEDFRTPSCATCHNSLLASPDDDEIVPRTHDFGERLWVRLFGLPYAHNQPKDGRTYLIKNKDALPLPTTFGGEPASEHLIDASEQRRRVNLMRSVCTSCHSTSWTNGHFDVLDRIVEETNRATRTATQIVQAAWEKGMADPGDPFDEAIEHKWVKQWVFSANSIRYGTAMMGPDYTAFKNGQWSITTGLRAMYERVFSPRSEQRRTERAEHDQ
jgi:hypothetical protein